jgi:hypothetical protein
MTYLNIAAITEMINEVVLRAYRGGVLESSGKAEVEPGCMERNPGRLYEYEAKYTWYRSSGWTQAVCTKVNGCDF